MTAENKTSRRRFCLYREVFYASAEENKASLSSVFTEEEVKITTESEKYTVRFFLLDLWEELKHRLSGTD